MHTHLTPFRATFGLVFTAALLLTACGGGGSGPAIKALPQTLTLMNPAPVLALGGTATVAAKASSGLAVSYSSLSPTVCSVHTNTGRVTDLAAGRLHHCRRSSRQRRLRTRGASQPKPARAGQPGANPEFWRSPGVGAVRHRHCVGHRQFGAGGALQQLDTNDLHSAHQQRCGDQPGGRQLQHRSRPAG
jgi:hypothetical protein